MAKRIKVKIEHDEDGWWGYTMDGWGNSCEGTHTFHEDTKADLMREIRDFLAPCDCRECEEAATAKQKISV